MDQKCASIITDHTFEKIELSLREPNIFRALSIERKELRHSNFIAYILDPRENHGLKDIVLRKLLRDIFSESKALNRTIFDADYIDLNNIEIRREWRSIDILIILNDDIIVIENKVDTVDHSNQLKRYHKIAEEVFPNKYRHYVYLTPFGSDPQDVESRDSYINYSYVQISEIIESILKLYNNSISQKISFYLSDYLTTVKRELLMNEGALPVFDGFHTLRHHPLKKRWTFSSASPKVHWGPWRKRDDTTFAGTTCILRTARFG